jgi:hypothetical protein
MHSTIPAVNVSYVKPHYATTSLNRMYYFHVFLNHYHKYQPDHNDHNYQQHHNYHNYQHHQLILI